MNYPPEVAAAFQVAVPYDDAHAVRAVAIAKPYIEALADFYARSPASRPVPTRSLSIVVELADFTTTGVIKNYKRMLPRLVFEYLGRGRGWVARQDRIGPPSPPSPASPAPYLRALLKRHPGWVVDNVHVHLYSIYHKTRNTDAVRAVAIAKAYLEKLGDFHASFPPPAGIETFPPEIRVAFANDIPWHEFRYAAGRGWTVKTVGPRTPVDDPVAYLRRHPGWGVDEVSVLPTAVYARLSMAQEEAMEVAQEVNADGNATSYADPHAYAAVRAKATARIRGAAVSAAEARSKRKQAAARIEEAVLHHLYRPGGSGFKRVAAGWPAAAAAHNALKRARRG